jgi:hypothetical protein
MKPQCQQVPHAVELEFDPPPQLTTPAWPSADGHFLRNALVRDGVRLGQRRCFFGGAPISDLTMVASGKAVAFGAAHWPSSHMHANDIAHQMARQRLPKDSKGCTATLPFPIMSLIDKKAICAQYRSPTHLHQLSCSCLPREGRSSVAHRCIAFSFMSLRTWRCSR